MKPCTSSSVFNTNIPTAPVSGSPNDALVRLAGKTVTKVATFNDGAGAHIEDLFTVTGSVEVKALWGVFTTTTETTSVTVCSWDISDGAAHVHITEEAAGTDCSGATVSSTIVKVAGAATAATFLKADQVRIYEIAAADRQYQGFMINPKTATNSTIRFYMTENAATNCVITFYCTWVARSSGATVVAV